MILIYMCNKGDNLCDTDVQLNAQMILIYMCNKGDNLCDTDV
jgi:hypothetical protein